MTAATALGSREAAVLEHLAAHPGLTATELARAFGLSAEPYKQLGALQQKGARRRRPGLAPGPGPERGPLAGRAARHGAAATARPRIRPSSAAAGSVTLRPSVPAGPAGARRAGRPAASCASACRRGVQGR